MIAEAPEDLIHHFTKFYVYLCFISIILSWLTWTRYHNGLHAIPGPLLASVSSYWKFNAIWCEDMPQRNTLLHEKYGPLVRIGPNHVSASSAEALQAIYRARSGFLKAIPFPLSIIPSLSLTTQQTSMYGILQPQFDNQILHNVFSTQDPVFHAALKRTIGILYTTTAVSEYEFHIDSGIQLFLSRVGDLVKHQSAIVDMSAWLQYYAFDTLGEINFSRKFGFLDTGMDVDGICKLDHKQMMYFALVRT